MPGGQLAAACPETLWENVINPDDGPRDLTDADVVELTGATRFRRPRRNDHRPAQGLDLCVIVRRGRPGAQLSLFEEAGHYHDQGS
ncbi:MAG TPA: hypothetical protein VI248_30095 [Kineosporiaceae bacterium]